ncbi:MAG: hypothetical protein HPY66_2944 [Firmicutes bacterium]|nr:hypothetical protein [Bacillota bacterium]
MKENKKLILICLVSLAVILMAPFIRGYVSTLVLGYNLYDLPQGELHDIYDNMQPDDKSDTDRDMDKAAGDLPAPGDV